MQAIIMAAGKGSRLGELSANKPKSFVEINGKSLVDINIHMLREHGIRDITIVTGFCSDLFEKKYNSDQDIHLKYNPFYGFTNVIGSFYMGMDNLYDDFIYMHADTLCDPLILEEMLCTDADIVLPIDAKQCDEEAMKVKAHNGSVIAISKKLDVADCDGEFIGVAKIASGVLEQLKFHTKELLKREAFSEYFEAALQAVIAEGDFKTVLVKTGTRFWAEIDFLEDFQRAQKAIPPILYRF